MKKYDKILLFSGGIDSYIGYHKLGQPQTLYFDLGSKASKKELAFIKKKLPNTIIDTSLKGLGETEEDLNAHIPYRNLYFAMTATKYSDTVYICGLKDDNMTDKNEGVFKEWSEHLSKLENRNIQILSPFWNKTKEDIIDWYIIASVDPFNVTDRDVLEELYECPSCYSKSLEPYCGECQCCFRKATALNRFNYHLKFKNEDIMKYYLERIEKGLYDHQPQRKISMFLYIQKNLLKDKKIYAIDIDGILTNETHGFDYENRTPNLDNIRKLRKIKEEGHRVVLFTSRYSIDKEITKKWLEIMDVPYDNIIFDKLFFDTFIDDKAISRIL